MSPFLPGRNGLLRDAYRIKPYIELLFGMFLAETLYIRADGIREESGVMPGCWFTTGR